MEINKTTSTSPSDDSTDTTSDAKSKSKPWLPAIMSLVLPGLGQLYNGESNRAIWLFVLFALVSVPLMAVVALLVPVRFTVFALLFANVLALSVWGYAVVNAWRSAGQMREKRPWQISGTYLLAFIACGLITLPLLIGYVNKNLVRSFKIPSRSMQPTLQQGDYLFADMRYNCPGCKHHLQRGDIAIFVYPNVRNYYYVKRVIGLPGDEITLSENRVMVNGQLLAEPSSSGEYAEKFGDRTWTVRGSVGGLTSDTTQQSFVVEPGHAFVLGDNREASRDSRAFGSVPLSDIVGKARQIFFSKNKEGFHWERFGLDLRIR